MQESVMDSKEYARGYLDALNFYIESLWKTYEPSKTIDDLLLSKRVVEIYLKSNV